MSLRVTCVAVVVALLGVSLVAAQFPDFEESTSEDLELVLPAFPLPPKRDRALLGMHATEALGVGNGERSEFEADDTPRFRATAESDAEDEEEAEAEDAESEEDGSAISGDEEAALVEAQADAAVAAAAHVSDAEADTTEEILEETMEDDSENEQPTTMAAAAAAVNPQAMRFASAMQRRYDDLTLPSGLPPALPSQNYAEIARLPVSAVGDALFTPIHPTEPQFPGAFSTPSLAGGRNNYAFAEHKRYPNYAYGNANWGAPVNAQFYPNPNPPAPAPAPAAAAAAPKKEAKAEAEAETTDESAGGEEAEAESSFMEVAEQQGLNQRQRNFQAQQQAMAQAMQQRLRQSAAAGVVYPYAPHLAPRNTPARNPAADLMHAEYQTYSRANWPSSVAPPPAYYLPPDVVAI